ncbi:MAG TPA: sigma-70 family RNA polymerase sigma factor [Actinoplanes sp.]|nr:sigma-70 family RNA polymerase sigma factor [Actinoplanes sp.]
MRASRPAALDEGAAWLSALHARHAEPLLRYLTRRTFGESCLAEDLLQEAMLRAWRHRAKIPDDHEQQRRWLFTVARHLATDALRARSVRPVEVGGLDLTQLPDRADHAQTVADTHSVIDALAELSHGHRVTLVHLYCLGHTVAETAERLGVPPGTVRSRSHYGLRALRAVLDGSSPINLRCQ